MIYFFVLLLFVILGLVKKESKIILWGVCCILFFLITQIKTGNDLENLERTFNMAIPADDYFTKSFIFTLFLLYVKDFGCSFLYFRIICFALWATAVFTVIFKYSKYPTFVVACCTFFPLLAFGAQIRNGVAVSFVYWAIFLLLKKGNVYGKLLYIALIFFGGLIHSSVFVYAFGVYAVSSISTKLLLRLSIFISIVFIFILQSGLLYSLISLTIGDFYADKYFSGMDGFDHHHMILFPCIFLNVFYSISFRDIVCRNSKIVGFEMVKFADFVMRFNIILLMVLPLMIISLSFFRVYQYMFILTVILLSIAAFSYNSQRKGYGDAIILIYLIFYFFITFYYDWWQGEFFSAFKSI